MKLLQINELDSRFSQQIKQNKEITQNIKKSFYIKAIVISLLMASFLLYRFLFSIDNKKNCVYDYLHQSTYTLNRYINRHCSHFFIGIAQVMIDLMVPLSTIFWTISVQNYKYPIVMVAFFYMRTIFFITNTMPFCSYEIWENPGFHAFLVPYDHTSDYFYSGHTGTCLIFYLEIRNLKMPKILQILALVCVFYMILILIILRVHYIIDIVGGLIFALFFHTLIWRNMKTVDKILNIPYVIGMQIIQQIGKRLDIHNKLTQNQGTSLYDIQHQVKY